MRRILTPMLILLFGMPATSTALWSASIFTSMQCITATLEEAINGVVIGDNIVNPTQCAELCSRTTNCKAWIMENGTCIANINTAMLVCPRNGTLTSGLTSVQIAVEVAMSAQDAVSCPADFPWAASNGLHCCKNPKKVSNPAIDHSCDGGSLTSSDTVRCCNGSSIICNNTLGGCTSWIVHGPVQFFVSNCHNVAKTNKYPKDRHGSSQCYNYDVMTSWTPWTLCTTTCGPNGTKTRYKLTSSGSCFDPGTQTAVPCSVETQTTSCHTFNCSCRTNSNSGLFMTSNTPCTFPMVYYNTYYPACTTARDNGNWCATNTLTTNYTYITGLNTWGFCNPDCPVCLTVDGPVVNTNCLFPFTYQNTTYPTCTTVNNGYNNGKAWCATGSDATVQWGICDDIRLCPKGN